MKNGVNNYSNSEEMKLGKALVARMKLLVDPDSAKKHNVQFSLIEFSQDRGFRVFAFEGTAADRTRTAYTVRADLALTRNHGIRVQELPLLWRGLLERAREGEQKSPAIFTEEEMRLHSHNGTEARDAAIPRRKSLRRPLAAQAESDI